MNDLPGVAEARERLRQTCFRDFGEVAQGAEYVGRGLKMQVPRDQAPVPELLRLGLEVAGFPSYGPGEKIAWWAPFTFRGEWCQLTHEKFGVRLYTRTAQSAVDQERQLLTILGKLRASVRTVEQMILTLAPSVINAGNVTVRNQHRTLQRAYKYFRTRATSPFLIEDRKVVRTYPPGSPVAQSTRFYDGKWQMQVNAFHDMVAAISAYTSRLEHDFVLALAFADFDPTNESLTDFIGDRWGDKWDRAVGGLGEASTFKSQLTEVIERWRNPYSHGGFEKGHSATVYLHVPGARAALPVGLSSIQGSPLFNMFAADEDDIVGVFSLFDKIDRWLRRGFPEASMWIEYDLDVRFDQAFRELVSEARAMSDFKRFVEYSSYVDDMRANMDF